MSAGTSKKATIYVGNLSPEVHEQQLLDAFVTFGDILEVIIPTEPHEPSKHRGFAFVTFASPADAQDAIDNYDLNELPGTRGSGRFLKCSIAQPNKFGNEAAGEQRFDRPVWESEEWLQKYSKPDEPNGEQNGEPAVAAGQETSGQAEEEE
ncbi:hypothetical protein BCR39DRAFT_522777 [Naematelia encephala]|uniref:RRM domain-containing protein n=1 Tax=Naematelia encephala TaxID=71784 RepID=A0A1Y2BCV9_9TREE|nr:hypothetical protein BCR39DRAFT_522777 [Naematelia encephala]